MSEKAKQNPASPGAAPARRSAGVSRRQFVRSGMYGTIGLFTAQALVGAGVMFWPAKVSGFGGRVPVPTKLQDISPGDAPVMVREGKFYLSRIDDDSIIALYWKCVHLGCTVPWNDAEGLFHCPCHGSMYDRTGQNVGGPAPRPLDYMEIAEISEDGTVIVDTGKIVPRSRHEPEHETKV